MFKKWFFKLITSKILLNRFFNDISWTTIDRSVGYLLIIYLKLIISVKLGEKGGIDRLEYITSSKFCKIHKTQYL